MNDSFTHTTETVIEKGFELTTKVSISEEERTTILFSTYNGNTIKVEMQADEDYDSLSTTVTTHFCNPSETVKENFTSSSKEDVEAFLERKKEAFLDYLICDYTPGDCFN